MTSEAITAPFKGLALGVFLPMWDLGRVAMRR